MNDAIKNELASYEARLSELGFHPKSVDAYVRKLEEFLEANPQSLGAGKDGSAKAIDGYLDAAPVAYDDYARAASLRKWHLLRYGSQLGRRRLSAADFATSPQIEDELRRLRKRLESDGRALARLGDRRVRAHEAAARGSRAPVLVTTGRARCRWTTPRSSTARRQPSWDF